MSRKIAILSLVILFCFTCQANEIVVSPPFKFQSADTSFNVIIYCTPSQTMKSFELKLSFNATLLQANSVAPGTIFDGYPTFFSAGIINNTAGTIINIYNLIIGLNNVSASGSLISVNFTGNSLVGVSSIHIYDEGITNETMYLEHETNDGDIQLYTYLPWDVNNDSEVDFLDCSLTIAHYREILPPGSQPWDIIIDGVVDYLDLSVLVSHYGE